MTIRNADRSPNVDSLARAAALVPSLAVALALAACANAPPPLPAAQVATPAPSPLTAGAPQIASPLSYGSVTSQVEKGKTTQLELLQAFGGPNISTLDRDGVETWVYERTATQSDVRSSAQVAQGAASLGAFFKYIDVNIGGSIGRSASSSSVSTSIRSLTVIVKFAPNKTVSDYSVRASTF
ncbi:MAG: hypothetical protein ABI699_08105 [Caldimonas sp.]